MNARRLLCILPLAASCALPAAAGETPKLDTSYVTDNFIAAVIAHPQRALESPLAKALDKHISEGLAEMKSHISIDAQSVTRFMLLVGPPGSGVVRDMPMELAMVFHLDKPLDAEGVIAAIARDGEKEDRTYNGETYYVKDNDHVAFHISKDLQRLMVTMTEERMQQMLDGKGSGPLAARLAKADIDHDALAVFVAEPVREFVDELKKNDELDATSRGALELPGLIDSGEVHADLTGDTLLSLSLETTGTDAAEKVHTIVNGLVGAGKFLFGGAKDDLREQVTAGFERAGIAVNIDDYMQMVSDTVDGVKVDKSETIVTLTVPRPESMDKVIEQIGLHNPMR